MVAKLAGGTEVARPCAARSQANFSVLKHHHIYSQ
jgi:hypothetical protein